MAWSKALDEKEIAYIEKSFPRLTCAEIARQLGRTTRCVQKAVNRLGLREPPAPRVRAEEERGAAAAGDGDERQDELACLRELRKSLKRLIREAGPSSAPALSKEYREVLARISELEGGDDGGSGGALGGASPDSLLVSIPLRPA